MNDNFVYVSRSDDTRLSHGLFTSLYSKLSKKESYTRAKSQNIIGKGLRTENPYGAFKVGKGREPAGGYKDPDYDPVKRHEYYEATKGHATRAYGTGAGKSAGKSSGRKKSGANLSKIIQSLREESNLNTEAQREATKRKIADLKAELQEHIKKLSDASESEDSSEGVNSSEIRGNIQSIKDQIEKAGGDLQKWISNERDALEKRIAAVYKKHGQKYKATTQADKKQASQKRDKEVNSRADAIYKSNRKT